MAVDERRTEIFPRDPDKTYGLMELVKGTSPMVDKGPDDTVFSFPIVALLELLLVLGTTLLLVVFSMARNAPLEEMANPNVTTNPSKAPWYFVGLQELLLHMHPTLAGVFIPTAVVLFLIALPYLDNSREGAGKWFGSPRGLRITIWGGLYALVVMPAFIIFDEFIGLQELLRGAPSLVGGFVVPAVVLGAIVALPCLVLLRWSPSMREMMILIFTLLMVTALVLTVSGFLFRGPGMHLYWPWQMPHGYNPLDSL
ncbi:MAG: hypothetical protein ACE5NP_07715 [Anaerolineae bacterium]